MKQLNQTNKNKQPQNLLWAGKAKLLIPQPGQERGSVLKVTIYWQGKFLGTWWLFCFFLAPDFSRVLQKFDSLKLFPLAQTAWRAGSDAALRCHKPCRNPAELPPLLWEPSAACARLLLEKETVWYWPEGIRGSWGGCELPEVTGEDGSALGPCLFVLCINGEVGVWVLPEQGPWRENPWQCSGWV